MQKRIITSVAVMLTVGIMSCPNYYNEAYGQISKNAGKSSSATVSAASKVTKPSKAAVAKTKSKLPTMKRTSRSGVSSMLQVKKNTLLLDWWTRVSTIFSRGTKAKVKDIYTGKVFDVMRTTGTNHADCEALTKEDTEIIKSIWGGFSWERRPVIVMVNGYNIAASMAGMPHAGIDSEPALATVKNRSDGYGTGLNYDFIKDNGMDGHFDIHFLNSTRHKDNNPDEQHQKAVMKAFELSE